MSTTMLRNEKEWGLRVLQRLDRLWGREKEYPMFCVMAAQEFNDINAVQELVKGEAEAVFDWRKGDDWQGKEDDLGAWRTVIAMDFKEGRTLLDLLFPTVETFASDNRLSGLSFMERMEMVGEVYGLDQQDRRAVEKAREAFGFFGAHRLDLRVYLRQAGNAGTVLTQNTKALVELQRMLLNGDERLDLEEAFKARKQVEDVVENAGKMRGDGARLQAVLEAGYKGWLEFHHMEAKGKARAD